MQPRTSAGNGATPWARAREIAYQTGRDAARPPVTAPLYACDGATLAADLSPLTDLPAFPTSTVDGWAVRGPAPWRIVGQVLAGSVAPSLDADGTCVSIATGAMVPTGAEAIVRIEESSVDGDLVTGTPRPEREWREPGDEAHHGDVLLPAGTPVTPAVIGLAASSGLDELWVRPRPSAMMLVFGDELLTSGPPGAGRVRDSLGPQVPAWLARLGVAMPDPPVIGPIQDTLDAHVGAIRQALATGADLIVTTGGTMHGPVDHLHPALAALDVRYAVNTVEVRPGFPMLLATLPNPRGGATLFAGLPGNPQSAVVALVSLVAPALAGLIGRPMPDLPSIRLGANIGGRGGFTHLALVRRDPGGDGRPLEHTASSMLRGLAQAVGFAVVAPGSDAAAGDVVPLVPLPLVAGEAP
jgi:molybdopterin molybdotransferase